MLKFSAFTVALILLMVGNAESKCGNSSIAIAGHIDGPRVGITIVVKVSPDPNWEPEPDVSVAVDGEFNATIYFDRTRSEGRIRDDCSRKPDNIRVELHRNGVLVDSAELVVARDFVKKGKTDFEVKSPVVLHSK